MELTHEAEILSTDAPDTVSTDAPDTVSSDYSTDSDYDPNDDSLIINNEARKKIKKNKSQHLTISKEDEKKIAEFIENSADYIFNKGSRYYKDKPKVVAAFAELGQTLSPPVSGKELRVWWYSIRSRYGRLTTKKKRSRQ